MGGSAVRGERPEGGDSVADSSAVGRHCRPHAPASALAEKHTRRCNKVDQDATGCAASAASALQH
eukprot:664430-Rhodomonas_salina.2